MGKLIIIEGLDGCGKSTQTALLEKYFEDNSVNFKKIKLPDYDSKSSTLVKMYLGGEFGKNADDVNAYAAGAFYAVDRFASYKLDWGKDYENGALILADRYATSNSIYQMEKIDEDKWDEYLDWSADFEYNCRKSALYTAKKQGWAVVPCSDGINPLPIKEIHNTILDFVKNELKEK